MDQTSFTKGTPHPLKRPSKSSLNKNNDGDAHLLDHTLVFYSGSDCKGNGREQERWKESVFMDTIHRFPYKDPIKSDKPDSETIEPKGVSKASLDPEGPKNA